MQERTTIRTKALPAANATAYTDPYDFGTSKPGPQGIRLSVSLPDLPDLVDTKKVTVIPQDSDDGISYATLETLGNMIVTGAGGVGASAKKWEFYLPPVFRRYVRFGFNVETGGGDNTAKSATVAQEL